MYIVIFSFNSDTAATMVSGKYVGEYSVKYQDINGSTTQELSVTQARSWSDGFKASVFFPESWAWVVTPLYVTFQLLLVVLALYMLIRGI